MDCTFCSKEIERGTGLIFVKRDGSTYPYCSSKCKKNALVLKRNPKRTKWVHSAAPAKKKK